MQLNHFNGGKTSHQTSERKNHMRHAKNHQLNLCSKKKERDSFNRRQMSTGKTMSLFCDYYFMKINKTNDQRTGRVFAHVFNPACNRSEPIIWIPLKIVQLKRHALFIQFHVLSANSHSSWHVNKYFYV